MSCLNIAREKKKKLNKNNLIALNFFFLPEMAKRRNNNAVHKILCMQLCEYSHPFFLKGELH